MGGVGWVEVEVAGGAVWVVMRWRWVVGGRWGLRGWVGGGGGVVGVCGAPGRVAGGGWGGLADVGSRIRIRGGDGLEFAWFLVGGVGVVAVVEGGWWGVGVAWDRRGARLGRSLIISVY